MAKKIQSGEQASVKVRIIDFEMSGSDESLRESLQTLAAALGRGQAMQVARALPPRQGRPVATIDGTVNEEVVEEEDETPEDTVVPRAARRAPSQRKPTSVSVLPDINFSDVTPTLKDFYQQKHPDSDLSRYLVVAYWYKHHRGINDLTVDHIHTAFRALGVGTPRNAIQPVRDLRNARNGKLTAGSSKGTFAIHHLGETAVEQMGRE